MAKKFNSRALLGSIAVVTALATIGVANAGTIQEQCATPGIPVGTGDPNNTSSGNNDVVAVPFTATVNPANVPLFQSGSNGTSMINSPSAVSNSLVVSTVHTSLGASNANCNSYLVLNLTGINQNATQVSASINSEYSSNADNSYTYSPVVNGTASLTFSIDGMATSESNSNAQTDTVTISIQNNTNQVLLPETVKLTATVVGNNTTNKTSNSYVLVQDADFLNVSGNGSLIFVPTAYIPSTATGTSNAIAAAYYTITVPQGVSATNVGVYVLNPSSSNGAAFCGNASSLAVSSSSVQNVNQIVLDLSKLVSVCGSNGVSLSNPAQLQSGIPILFTVSNVSSPANITADGYSVFRLGDSSYVKRLDTKVVSGSPSSN